MNDAVAAGRRGGRSSTAETKPRLTLPRTPSLFYTARLSIRPKAASALELVLRHLVRPKQQRGPWWLSTEHLIAAACEAEDLYSVAKNQAARLAGLEGTEALAAIAAEAERELREIAHRLRVRVPAVYRLVCAAPGTVLRPTSAVRITSLPDRSVLVNLAVTLARDNPRRPQWRPKVDRRPLVALRKDVEVLAAQVSPGVVWPESWGDLRAITDIATTANDLAERIEDAVEPPSPKGRRRTRRYAPRSADEPRKADGETKEDG